MATIVIFDSGVGGLSIHSEVAGLLPEHRYVFVSDNLAYPYGTKPEDELKGRVMKVMHRIADAHQPDIVIVACNTASTVVLPLLRQEFEFSIVGVVPAIKTASAQSKTKHIGLLATPGTIAREYTGRLIKEFAADCQVIKVGTSSMVDIAEDKLYGRDLDLQVLETTLRPFLVDEKCDQLVLACTHFPLLNNEISTIFKANDHQINLVDSGQGIARRVSYLLDQNKVSQGAPDSWSNEIADSIALFTKPIDDEPGFIEHLEELGLHHAGVIPS